MKIEFQILLIEDDFEYADYLRSLIDDQTLYSFKYERVSTISEASKLLRENRFDTILLDFDLTNMTDPDRVRDLSNEAPDTPIIGLFNTADEDKANEAAAFGLQDKIIKHPYDEHMIVSKVIFSINRAEANHNNRTKRNPFSSEALFDSRSGLPNEILFHDRLEQAINRADRDHTSVGLLTVSLQNFIPVNDQYGSKVGDAVLKKVANLFNQNIRKSDTVAHISNDKFMVVLEKMDKTSNATMLAERIIRAFSRRMRVADYDIKMTASAGISVYPDCNGLELIKSAEQAMNRAIKAGGNRYKLFTENISEEAIWKYQLENDLVKALTHQQFELHYQPLFDLKEQRVYGLEALLRWNHPEMGLLMPDSFISKLEESDKIIEVGAWVIEEACKKLSFLQTKYPHLSMSINLTARQLEDTYLLERIGSILKKYAIKPQHLELEITERQAVDKDDSISQYHIKNLSEMGLTIALDDFGQGYSSEAYFRHFPADTIQTLKIDREDTNKMLKDDEIAAKVISYVKFSHDKDLRVIAEGIENNEQLAFMKSLGVRFIQGYLLSKPVSGSEIEDGLRRNDYSLETEKLTEGMQIHS